MFLKVVTPKAEELVAETNSVTVPGGCGEMTVLPGHTALLSTLEVGVLSYETKDGPKPVAVNRGLVEVLDDTITVLTETCEVPAKIDVERAQASKERAEERLGSTGEDLDVLRAELALRRAIARLKIAR